MGLPPSLVGQAQQTVGNAMATGGRGSETFATNYEPLSNAFMKKAQLDMNMADLHASNANSRASLLGGLSMDRANLHMQAAGQQLQLDMYNDQKRREDEANTLSPFEQITGVLTGAAAGAAGGAAFGPAGIAIGAVAGGGMTAMAGKDRRKQSSAIQSVGIIANATSAIKGTLDKKSAQDAMGTRLDDMASAAQILKTAAPGSEEHMKAQNDIDTSINGFVKESVKSGVPLHQAVNSGAEMRKMAMGGYDPSDPKQKYTRQFENTMVEAAANPRIQKGDRRAIEGLKSDLATSYQMAHGGKVTKTMMKDWMNQIGSNFNGADGAPMPNQAFGTDYYGGNKNRAPMRTSNGTQVHSDEGIASIRTQTNDPRTGDSVVTSGADRSGAPVRPQGSIGDSFGVMAPPSGGGSGQYGVTMDNMESVTQGRITEASTEMAKDPSIAAKALGKDELVDSANDTEDMGMIDKIKHNMSLSDDEFDSKKKPLWEKDSKKPLWEKDSKKQKMEAPRAATERSESGASIPEISSTRPEAAAKEKVFKTATDADDMLDTFNLRGGKYTDKAINEKVLGLANAASELNSFEKLVLDEEPFLNNMTNEQRLAFQTYMKGKGEGAMKGGGGGVNGSAMGVSFGGTLNSFRRDMQLEMEGRGEHFNLTDEQVKGLYKITVKANPVARTIAMEYNKGMLTEQDVEGFYNGLYNMFESDPEIASSGMQGMKDSLWQKFKYTAEGNKTTASRNQDDLDMARRKQQQKQRINDEAKLDDDFDY